MENLKFFFVCFFEICFLKMFMDTFCEYISKKHHEYSFLMVISLSIVSCISTFLFQNLFFLKESAFVVLVVIFSKMIYKTSCIKVVTLAVIYIVLLLLTDFLSISIYMKLFLGEEEPLATNNLVFAGMVSLSKILLFLVIILIKKFLSKGKNGVLSDSEWIKFLFLPVFSIIIFSLFIGKGNEYVNTRYQELFGIAAFGIVGLNIFMFYLMQDIAKREQKDRENKLAEIKANNQLSLYQSITENYEKQSEKLHEYKNQIECLQTLSESRKYKELENYLEQIGGEVVQELDAVDTNNVVVNAVINKKYREAIENNIVVVFQLSDLSEFWLDEKNTVVILANLLDNAIEACRKTEGRKVITIKISIEGGALLLSVRNTYNGKLNCEEGTYLTTKENSKLEHGIGIKNIIKAVEKYGGTYAITPTEEEFIFSISIPGTRTAN